MSRVVIMSWKNGRKKPIEVFSNLKILCESYPAYNYNTLNNYLSKNKIPYENADVRIERMIIQTSAIPQRKIKMVARKVKMRDHDEEKQNREYWLLRTPGERLEAVTRLSAQLKKHPNERMNKSLHQKRRSG